MSYFFDAEVTLVERQQFKINPFQLLIREDSVFFCYIFILNDLQTIGLK